MRASPVSDEMRPVSIAYRFVALVRSVADAPGKLAAVNIAFADSLERRPKFAVGTSVWVLSQTSPWTIEPPNDTLCLPLIHVAVSSITVVEASRAEYCEAPPLVAVTPVFKLVS
jgi:hypothetical protein